MRQREHAGASGIGVQALGSWCGGAGVRWGEGGTTRPEGRVGAVAGCHGLWTTVCRTSFLLPLLRALNLLGLCWTGGPEMNARPRGRES